MDSRSEAAEMASGPGHDLCEYCAEIDFEMLQNPTAADIRLLNAGGVPKDQYPYKNEKSDQVDVRRSLGLHSRIEKSAAKCPLCAAVLKIHKQQPHVLDSLRTVGVVDPLCIASIAPSGRLLPPEGVTWRALGTEDVGFFYLRQLSLEFRPPDAGEVVQPGALLDTSYIRWQRLTDCFQSYQGEDMSANGWLVPKEQDRTLFGGRKRPPMLDPKLPELWLHDCLTNHAGACGFTNESAVTCDTVPTRLFRLLDAKERVIRDLHNVHLSQLTYVALSYVWGGKQRTTLQTSNYADLHIPGSLVGRVSQTVEDALYLADALGVRYLWVDALCIIQDSEDDKAAQLSSMGKVYANSLFTIVAAAGADSEAGLPGIRAPRTAVQKEVAVLRGASGPPVCLLSTLTPGKRAYEHCTQNTIWASRGWTLQERALTRRAIIVMKEQILWSCDKSRWAEESCCESSLAQVSWFALHESEYFLNSSVRNWFTFDDESDQVWYRLRHLILDYTSRKLTVEGDAFDAFSSILQQVTEKEGEHFLWGIPATRFELGLCWEPHRQGLRKRTCLSTLDMTTLKRKVPFPSWSWIGWEGVVNFRVEDRYLELGLDPVILCYVLRQDPLRLVRVSRISIDSPNANARPWQNPTILFKSPLTVTLEDVQQHYTGILWDDLANTPDDQLLFFWTELARFTVSEVINITPPYAVSTPLEDTYKKHSREITDVDGNVVGQTATCQVVSDDEESEGGECEFILLASNTPPEHEKHNLVMQIKRRGGIAYRVNIADIRVDAWDAANTVRTLVALG